MFISSDEDEVAARAYHKESHGDWVMVPFDSPLRWALKKRFGIWAGKEREVLGTEGRRSGIPTLILVDAATGEELDFLARGKVEDAISKGGGVRVDACIHSFAVSKKLDSNLHS